MTTTDELLCPTILTSGENALDNLVELAAYTQFEVRDPVFLKVEFPVSAKSVCVSFDPVSMEEIRQTRELNQSIRLGFMPPAVSTR